MIKITYSDGTYRTTVIESGEISVRDFFASKGIQIENKDVTVNMMTVRPSEYDNLISTFGHVAETGTATLIAMGRKDNA